MNSTDFENELQNTASAIAKDARDTAATMTDRLRETASTVGDEARETAKAVLEKSTGALRDAQKAISESDFVTKAQEAVETAIDIAVDTVRKHPVAAAAIAGGVAATVVGAAYGVSRLRDEKDG